MAATLLPDDLVREILLRVSTDVAALFRCAVTCKRWRALVADRSFLRDLCWPENTRHPSSLIGFFQLQHHMTPGFSPVSPGSLLGSSCFRELTSIITDESYYDVLDRAEPLATRGGLVLVRLRCPYWIHLAVCNILTGTCDVIPLLRCIGSWWNIAILTCEDCPSLNGQQGERPTLSAGYSIFFKVIAIVHTYHDGEHNLYTFSSTEPNWSEPTKLFHEAWQHGKVNLRILDGSSNVVVCRGVAHWLAACRTNLGGIYYTFDVNVKTSHVSLTELSIPRYQLAITSYAELMLTGTVDGRLSLLHLHEESLRINFWTQGDDGTWLCTRVIKLNPQKKVPDLSFVCMWLGQKSGTMFIRDRDRVVYKIDTETGAMEDVTSKIFLSTMALPVEIDWPAFFISRLSV